MEQNQEEKEQAEQDGLSKHGWYIHIHDEVDEAGNANYHTHGLITKYDGLDLQIVRPNLAGSVPMSHVLINLVFWQFADMIAAGRGGEIKHGSKHFIPKLDMNVMLAHAIEGGRLVYRIIFSDEDGHLKSADQAPAYATQWIGAVTL